MLGKFIALLAYIIYVSATAWHARVIYKNNKLIVTD